MRATLFYDGSCGFCDASVRWLAARDRRGVFRLLARDSAEADRELRAAGVDPASVDSIVLVRDGRAWVRSDAVLEALRLFGLPWSLAGVARIVPRGMRDALYRTVARHRHAWSARARARGATPEALDSCDLPPPGARRG
jgi:predicted DCC family thiol-disulfide oxidoreductase YuxK